MGRVIAVANQKGGVGKTTTAVNLAASLGMLGKKVLLIDCDPQGNATSGVGLEKNELVYTLYDVLVADAYVEEAIVESAIENVYVIGSNIHLSGAEIELLSYAQREYVIKSMVDSVKEAYDFVFLDCPPSLNILTVNALTAADSLIIPLQCEYYALEGLTQLLHTVQLVQTTLNPSLMVEGILFTMFDSRTNLSIQVVDNVKNHHKQLVFPILIPRNVRVSEAPSHGLPITIYDPTSKGALAYMELASYIVEQHDEETKDDIYE